MAIRKIYFFNPYLIFYKEMINPLQIEDDEKNFYKEKVNYIL